MRKCTVNIKVEGIKIKTADTSGKNEKKNYNMIRDAKKKKKKKKLIAKEREN